MSHDEQLVVSVTSIQIKLRGYALVVLALGIAATFGCGVIIKLALF